MTANCARRIFLQKDRLLQVKIEAGCGASTLARSTFFSLISCVAKKRT